MTEVPIAHEASLAEQALPIGTTLSGEQFTITGQLGAGGFGITYRAQDNVLGREIVIKECFPQDFCMRFDKNVVVRNKTHADPFRSIVDMFMREARSLAKLRHPNIVGVHRAFEENQTAYMAIDLIDGRDLFDILDEHAALLSPARVKNILVQLLDAIEKVHEAGLLHRDISPDNVIIEKTGTPVLIDFGAARADATRHTRAVSSMMVVKDGYSPQEFYVVGSDQSPCSDLYALGATFYHVISGRPPPNSQSRVFAITGKRPDPCKPLVGRFDGYDRDFLDAIDQAMQIHPNDRLQSAAKWKAMIASSEVEEAERQSSRPRSSPSDLSLELELSLSRLVEETNDQVRKSVAEPVKVEEPVEEVQVTSRPNWVDEFNRDTMEPPVVDAAADDDGDDWVVDFDDGETEKTPVISRPVSARPERVQSETNWVDRAIEKQERIRSERLAQFEAEQRAIAERVKSVPGVAASNPISPSSNTDYDKRRPLKIAIGLLIGFGAVLLYSGVT